MPKYRIKEYDLSNEHNKNFYYKIQRKSFLGFWYNPDGWNEYTSGIYDTLEAAKIELTNKLTKAKIKIVYYVDTRNFIPKLIENNYK